ncbi:MAG: hypothetical protein WAU59_16490, partial [Rhodoplanes sp.]
MTPTPHSYTSPLRRLIHALAVVAATSALALGVAAPAFPQAQRQMQPASEARRPNAPAPDADRARASTDDAKSAAASSETNRANPSAEQGQQSAGRDHAAQEATRKLPADAITDHTLALPGRTLRFKATAGSIPLFDGDGGKLQAEIAYVAFVSGDPAAGRPVTFVFNGGPGAASAYLNIGALGPWRLPFDR